MNYTKNEQRIIDFCIENAKELSDYTIVQLAEASYTTPSSISKLVRKLEIGSYIEFKMYFKKNYVINEMNEDFDFTKHYIDSLKEASSSVNDENIKNIANKLTSIDMLLVYGVGGSGMAAKYFVSNAIKLGINAIYIADYFQMTQMLNNHNDHHIMLISNSGNTSEIVEILNNVDQTKHTIIGFTAKKNSYLNDIANYTIYYKEPIINIGAFSSISLPAQVMILDMLLNEMSKLMVARIKFNTK